MKQNKDEQCIKMTGISQKGNHLQLGHFITLKQRKRYNNRQHSLLCENQPSTLIYLAPQMHGCRGAGQLRGDKVADDWQADRANGRWSGSKKWKKG